MARLEKIKAWLAHQEYNKMVHTPKVWMYIMLLCLMVIYWCVQQVGMRDAGLEGKQNVLLYRFVIIWFVVRAVYQQLGVFINMIFTVASSFAFGYFATYYSSYRPETVSVCGESSFCMCYSVSLL